MAPSRRATPNSSLSWSRRAQAQILALCVGTALGPLGCASSTYRVRNRELLVQQMHMGTPVYAVEGRSYNGTPMSGGLAAAVATVPEARELAEAAHDSMVAFLLTYVGGLVAVGVGAGMTAISMPANGAPNGMAGAGTTILGAGLVGVGASIWFATRAEALRTDAVAAYNDAVLDRLRAQLPATPATPSAPPPAIPSEGPAGD